MPAAADLDAGCAFRARCVSAASECAAAPPLRSVSDGLSRCWFAA
jgi:ABC-type dipeptide/oligopeptide/nickel transport system ATPase component